jgi:hypothetical protein
MSVMRRKEVYSIFGINYYDDHTEMIDLGAKYHLNAAIRKAKKKFLKTTYDDIVVFTDIKSALPDHYNLHKVYSAYEDLSELCDQYEDLSRSEITRIYFSTRISKKDLDIEIEKIEQPKEEFVKPTGITYLE